VAADIAGTAITNAHLLVDSETASLLGSLSDLDWSPDGSRIGFISDGEIFVIDTLTRDLTPVVPATPVSFIRDFAWSPDGSRFAFAFGVDCCDKSGIGVMGADGAGPLEVASIPRPSLDFNPSWSPDGNEIVFVRGGDLWIVPASGGPARELLHLQQWIRRAQWAW
jgi:Tol biopolymer transport system component